MNYCFFETPTMNNCIEFNNKLMGAPHEIFEKFRQSKGWNKRDEDMDGGDLLMLFSVRYSGIRRFNLGTMTVEDLPDEVSVVWALIVEYQHEGIVVQLLTPTQLNWNRGPSMPSRYYILYNDGGLGVFNYPAQTLQTPLSQSTVYMMDSNVTREILRHDDECSICLDDKTDRYTPCGHAFCHQCIETCLELEGRGGSSECPICRQPKALTRAVTLS